VTVQLAFNMPITCQKLNSGKTRAGFLVKSLPETDKKINY